MEILNLLDKRQASKRIRIRVSLLTSIYSKRYSETSISTYKYEFSQLFAQVETMGEDAHPLDSHHLAILLANIGNYPGLEGIVAAVHLRDADYLSWECVTSGLIEEYACLCNQDESSKAGVHLEQTGSQKNKGDHCHSANVSRKGVELQEGKYKCQFYGKAGRAADECFKTPDSPNCRIKDQDDNPCEQRPQRERNIMKNQRKSFVWGLCMLRRKTAYGNPFCLDS